MSSLTFKNSGESKSTVNKLLSTILPGHNTTEESKKQFLPSTSQVINASQKKLNPETVRRLKKKEKLAKRLAIRKESQQRDLISSTARFEVLNKHSLEGSLTKAEKIELKKLVKKNVVGVQSWRSDVADDIQDIQKEILNLKKTDYDDRKGKKKRITKKVEIKDLYKKKQEHKYPGLTPGLAPVGLDDSDSDSD